MAVGMKVNGLKIIWKEWEYIFGMMVVFMQANIKTIRSMALESTPGLMEDAMKVIGFVENSTGWALTLYLRTKS